MIQDIAPHKLDNAFRKTDAGLESIVFVFNKRNVLVERRKHDGLESFRFPVIKQFAGNEDKIRERAIYAFSVDDIQMFLLPGQELDGTIPDSMEFINIRELYKKEDRWMALAAVTASHLNNWYVQHRYCGCCGSLMAHSENERAMFCHSCGNIQYPRISPVIMAAVTDGDKLLVTRYAGREYKGLALIAGFVEIGESIEGALKREVMEEVGLNVKDLRYFGSQPWGFSDSVISGFFADVDGSSQVRLDRDELSEAVWLTRDELPKLNNDMSITAVMIEAFRTGKY